MTPLTVYEDSRYLWEKIDEEIRPTNYIPAEKEVPDKKNIGISGLKIKLSML